MCVCWVCACECWEARIWHQIPQSWSYRHSELPDVGAGNQTSVKAVRALNY